MPDHNPMVEQGQGREPGDDYPGERYDAEVAIDRRGDHYRLPETARSGEAAYSLWWHRQPVPFCHAAALQADALRDLLRGRHRQLRCPGLASPAYLHALPHCAGCGGPIPGFTVGGRYCSITCYRDFEGGQ